MPSYLCGSKGKIDRCIIAESPEDAISQAADFWGILPEGVRFLGRQESNVARDASYIRKLNGGWKRPKEES